MYYKEFTNGVWTFPLYYTILLCYVMFCNVVRVAVVWNRVECYELVLVFAFVFCLF